MAVSGRVRAWATIGVIAVLSMLVAWWSWRDAPPGDPVEAPLAAGGPRGARGPRRAAPAAPPPRRPQEERAADSQMEEEPPRAFTVRCRVDEALLAGLSEVVVAGRPAPFAVEGDELVLTGAPPRGEMTLLAEGAAPLVAEWAETSAPGLARCVDEPLSAPPSGVVRGVIMNLGEWPQARSWARVCGVSARPRRDGRFEVVVPEGVCDVLAQRRDGLFFASSEVVTLEIEAGGVYEVELWLPDYRQGGVGMGIVEHEEGVLIQRVLQGGAAAEAGLQPGDLVLEVDGVPAAALTLEEFVRVTTGEAGTEVELVISHGEGSDREESILLLDRRVME